MWYARLLYVCLVSVTLMAMGNFIGALITREPVPLAYYANFTFTLLAGLIINLGTIIQVISLLHARRSGTRPGIHYDYTSCLVAGCFLLVVCQLYAYVVGANANVEFLCTLLTTLLSFLCTSAFWLTSRYALPSVSANDDDRVDDDEKKKNESAV